MSYSNPTTACYTVRTAAVDTGATMDTIKGPSGMKGRVVDVSYVVAVEVTGTASVITVGLSGDTDAYVSSLSIPAGIVGVAGNGATMVADHEIPADTIVLVTSSGAATAGDADLFVIIDWY